MQDITDVGSVSVGKYPLKRKWQSALEFLLGNLMDRRTGGLQSMNSSSRLRHDTEHLSTICHRQCYSNLREYGITGKAWYPRGKATF